MQVMIPSNKHSVSRNDIFIVAYKDNNITVCLEGQPTVERATKAIDTLNQHNKRAGLTETVYCAIPIEEIQWVDKEGNGMVLDTKTYYEPMWKKA